MLQHKSKNEKSKKDISSVRLTWANDFLFEQYPDAILVADERGIMLDVNKHLTDMLGYSKSEMVGKRIEMLMPKSYRSGHVAKHQGHMKHGHGRAMETGMKFLAERKNGTTFPIDIMLSPAKTKDGKVTVTVIRDISEMREAQASEYKAKTALKSVIDAAPVAIMEIDRHRNVLSWSLEAEKLFGYAPDETLGNPYRLIPEDKDSIAEFTKLFDKVFAGKTVHDLHQKCVHKDGALIDVSLSAAPVLDGEGRIYAVTYCAQDMSERLAGEAKLNQIAYFDQYSSMPNREHLKKDIGNYLNPKFEQESLSCFVAKMRFEGFAEINNTLGQGFSDQLIMEVEKRFKAVIFDKLMFYRTNTYEFATVVPNCTDPVIIAELLEPLIEQIHLPFCVNDQTIHLQASTGIGISTNNGNTVEELLANTSLALSAAIADDSRNCVFFDTSLKTKVNVKRQLDLDLRYAFDNGEFELFYQPQIRLSDGALIGAEALLRWRHPTRGLILPHAFIDTLAKHPISYEVGDWVLHTALQQAKKWRNMNMPDFRMGVNLFAAQFEHGTLVSDVELALDQVNLPPSALELEITENIAIGFDKKIIDPLKILKTLGVHIAFDDFGTGFASLSYLVKYPLSRIKIDRSFLSNIPQSKEEEAIVHATILMAHSLGLEVIAEGIETSEQEAFLISEHCEEGQGYLYAKPICADEFTAYFKVAQYRQIAQQLSDLSRIVA